MIGTHIHASIVAAALVLPQAGAPLALGTALEARLDVDRPTLELAFRSPRSTTITAAVESLDFDALIEVRTGAGLLIATADGGGLGTDARLVVEVEPEAEHRLVVRSKPGGAGSLRVWVEAGSRPLDFGRERSRAEIEYWREAGRRAVERDDPQRALLALRIAGQLSLRLGNHTAAVELLTQAVELAPRYPWAAGEATFAQALLGVTFARLGESARAFELLEAARLRLRDMNLPELQGSVLEHLGDLHLMRADREAAAREFELLGELALATGLEPMQAITLGRLAKVAEAARDPEEAYALHERRLELARRLGPDALASALLEFGCFLERAGELQQARELLGEALATTVDEVQRADILGGLGMVEQRAGHFARARQHFEAALELALALGHERFVVDAAQCLARLAWSLGDFEQTRSMLEYAFARVPEQAVGSRAALLNELGLLLGEQTRFEERRDHHRRALELAREHGFVDGQIRSLINLGQAQRQLDEREDARSSAHAAHDLALAAGERYLAALAEVNLGYLDLLDGGLEAALERSRRSLETLRALDRIEDTCAPLETIARASIQRGDIPAAAAALRDASDVLELGELTIDEAAGRRSRHAWWAETLAQDLTQLRVASSPSGSAERAAAIAEGYRETGKWKQRALLEGIVRRRGSSAAPTVVADSLRALHDACVGTDTVVIEYSNGSRDLFAYALSADGLELVPLGARASIEDLAQGFLHLVSSQDTLGSPARIADLGQELYAALVQPVLDALENDPGTLVIVPTATLATLPFEALVVDTAVPAGSVETFAQLVFVLDRFLVVQAPSSPILAELASRSPPAQRGRALLVGDPFYESNLPDGRAPLLASLRVPAEGAGFARLKGTRHEVVAVAGLFLDRVPSAEDGRALELLAEQRSGVLTTESFTLLLGEQASPERLIRELVGCRVLHLGAHGFVDADDPRNTGLALTASSDGNGYLSIGDVLELDVDLDLVVLSACDTARGCLLRGEGIQSMTRAFFHSGARAVIASLWQVRDVETAELMRTFYAGWLKDGLAASRALRAAKLELRGSHQVSEAASAARGRPLRATSGGRFTDHPFFWAACIYVGLPPEP